MATYSAKKNEVSRNWHVVNLENRVLGRAATEIARILRGKNKPQYTTHMDTGDFVVAINASKVKLTGNKLDQKTYYRHTGFPGGIREIGAADMLKQKPEEMLRLAVEGMLPKNILGRQMLKKLKIYKGDKHPHTAQKPKELAV